MEPISGIIFGIICAIVADSRGRSPVGWFFIGFFISCFGLILLLVLPDLKIMEQRESRLQNENRRLREQIRRDRSLADSRYSETLRRLDVHDDVLQIDTATPPALTRENAPALLEAEGGSGQYVEAAWWYADPDASEQIGPVSFAKMQDLWHDGDIDEQTLVWCELLENWERVSDVWELEERLDA